MKDSNLIHLLGSFSKKELRLCRRWISSPAHNLREDIIELYDYLVGEETGFRQECLDRELIWTFLYKEQKYSENLMRQVIYHLGKAVEDFLIYEEFKKDKLQNKLFLLKALNNRNIEKLYTKRLKEAEKEQHRAIYQDSLYYQNQYDLELEKFMYAAKQSRKVDNLQIVSDSLDIRYCTEKLRVMCSLYSHSVVYKQDYSPKLLESILENVEKYNWDEIPAVGVYYHGFLSMRNDEASLKHFQALLEHLDKDKEVLPPRTIRELYMIALNYAIKQLNAGKPNAVQYAFNLYKNGITQGYLIENGVLTVWSYRNTVACGLSLGEFDWVETFINNYKNNLERKYRKDAHAECLSKLYYTKKEYQKAMTLLVNLELKDVLRNLAAKVMLAKIYYELEEFEALDSLLVSIKAYIRRKRIIAYHAENYSNFIRFLQKLLSTNYLDKTLRTNLINEINETKPLTDRNWLLEQLDALGI
ncbi:MAG: hypothetical protein MK212_01315 [Saprospiraceae bacterium]|nr:hypothetical protein [Saprospiraceae bacterium]